MSVAAKTAALLAWLKGYDFTTMKPADRRHLRDLCRFIADRADPDAPPMPKDGVLADLRNGRRSE
jgi:hypothetical protein